MNEAQNKNFVYRVTAIVAEIPSGRVMTYGQIATLAGSPRAARIVGGIAHFGAPDLPWHRVVNKTGGMARGYSFGGPTAQRTLLESEDVTFKNDRVDIDKCLWNPHE